MSFSDQPAGGSAGPPADERYRVVRRLGAGGMASVHLAEDLRLGRLVALKRLHAERAGELGRRIRREARLAASLQHPNLVTVYDAQTEGDDVLIVMEYVEGGTLRETMRGGPLPVERTLEVLGAVASALDAVHARGIVHRDVKPPNILLGIDGRVKLADLGVALGADVTRITTSGSVLGTLPYMAPEQLAGEVTPAVDVFALAAVAYECLTGLKARRGKTPVEVMRQVESDECPDLRAALPDAPAAAADALRRAMSRDPAERPGSAGAMVAELKRALRPAPRRVVEPRQPRPVVAPPPAPPQPERRAAPASVDAAPVPAAADSGHDRGRPGGGRGGRAAIAALATAVVAAAIAVPLALSRGGGSPRHTTAASSGRSASSGSGSKPSSGSASNAATGSSSSSSSSSGTSTGSSGASTPAPAASGAPATPADTVRAFYERAAQKRMAEAWSLLSSNWKSQYGSFSNFSQSDLATLQSIRFLQLHTVDQSGSSATVALKTVAVHSTHTDHCQGTLLAVRSGSGWLLQPQAVHCS